VGGRKKSTGRKGCAAKDKADGRQSEERFIERKTLDAAE
jgi:hypothetical protein